MKLHATKALAAALGPIEDRQPLLRLSADEVRGVLAASAAAGFPFPAAVGGERTNGPVRAPVAAPG